MFAAFIFRRASNITRIHVLQQSVRFRAQRSRMATNRDAISFDFSQAVPLGFEQHLRDVILNQDVVDWERIRDEEFLKVQEENRDVFRGSFATAIFLALVDSESFTHLRQFVDHTGLENLGVTHIAKYMKLCEDPDEILRCWNFLSERHAIFTTLVSHSIAEALCRTSKWRDALKLIRESDSLPGPKLTSVVAQRMFLEGSFDEGIEWLKFSGKRPWIGSYSESIVENDEIAIDFLEYMVRVGARFEVGFDVTQSKPWCKKFEVEQVQIYRRRCCKCKTLFPEGKLTPEEFQKLKKSTLERVLKQENIYLCSHPAELTTFENFMNENGPFDAVIDGLNLIYKFERPARAIEAACQEYHDEGFKRILILSRAHAMRLLKKLSLPPGVVFYSVADVSKDDPYLLMAALMSHRDCRMLTSDILRDHIYKYKQQLLTNPEDDTYEIFERWYTTRKDYCSVSGFGRDKKILRFAPKHFIVPFKDSHGWHIPHFLAPGVVTKWFCIRRRIPDLYDE